MNDAEVASNTGFHLTYYYKMHKKFSDKSEFHTAVASSF